MEIRYRKGKGPGWEKPFQVGRVLEQAHLIIRGFNAREMEDGRKRLYVVNGVSIVNEAPNLVYGFVEVWEMGRMSFAWKKRQLRWVFTEGRIQVSTKFDEKGA